RDTGHQSGHARHVAVVFTRLVGGTKDEVIETLAKSGVATRQGRDDVGRQIVRAHRREGALEAANRRAYGVQQKSVAERAYGSVVNSGRSSGDGREGRAVELLHLGSRCAARRRGGRHVRDGDFGELAERLA